MSLVMLFPSIQPYMISFYVFYCFYKVYRERDIQYLIGHFYSFFFSDWYFLSLNSHFCLFKYLHHLGRVFILLLIL